MNKSQPQSSDAFTCRQCGRALGWCEPNVCDECSDQPPAKATDDKQEWWVELGFHSDECCIFNGHGKLIVSGLNRLPAEAICIAHNAELAAEQDRVKYNNEQGEFVGRGALEERNEQLRQDLVAERQRREQSEEDIADAIDYLDGNMAVLELHDGELCEKLISAVSAKFGHAPDELPKLRQQLLSALAAIEGILEADKTNKELDLSIAIENCKHVDLSALREHDEKVRKPLIDGLNRLMALVDVKCIEQAKRAYGAALVKMKP
jgi:hypothetical protein